MREFKRSGDEMDFRQLETFVEVVNLESFSKAAAKLFLTQPTITSHIQNLEHELGTLLINRSSKNISPTDAGKLLYKHALNIINLRDTAEFDLGLFKGKIQGNLEISSSSIPRQYLLPHIIKEFTEEYPDITLSINDNDSKNVVEDIIAGLNDFGIVGAKFQSPKLEYIDLLEDELVIITPNNKNYSFDTNTTLDLTFLMKEKIILREEGSGTRLLFEDSIKAAGYNFDKLNIVSCIKDTETIKKFVELGLGISIISKRAVDREVTLGVLKSYSIKDLNLKRKFYFVYHKNRILSPLGQAFKSFVIDYISENVSI